MMHMTLPQPEIGFSPPAQLVLRFLNDKGSATTREIKSRAEGAAEKLDLARKALFELSDKGWVTRLNEGGRGKEGLFSLTVAGRGKGKRMEA